MGTLARPRIVAARCALLVAVIAAVESGGAAPARAASSDFIFTPVVDTSATVPGGSAVFTSFEDAAFDGSNVVFHAAHSGGGQGVYLWNGSTMTTVANTSTSLPGGGGNFASFNDLSIDAGQVAFFGGNATREGVYTTLGGGLRRVVDTTTALPGGGPTYDPNWIDSSFSVAIDAGEIIFSASGGSGSGNANEGIFLESSGTVSRVADRNTPPPDTTFGNFDRFGAVDIDNGEVLFTADLDTPNSWGFYTSAGADPGQLRKAIDANTPIPGLPTPTFQFLPNTIRVDDDDVVFVASFVFRNGLYKERNGQVSIIADELRIDPITGNPFSTFGGTYSYDDGATAFVANSSGTSSGIYFDRQGGLVDVINEDFSLGGNQVDRVTLFRESLASNSILFSVEFVNGGDALYLASLLELEQFVAGDYNRNGRVDAPDFNLWRDTFGQTGSQLAADGNENGRVDASDFLIWRDNFGKTGGGLRSAIPEPGTLALGLILFIMAFAGRPRSLSRLA